MTSSAVSVNLLVLRLSEYQELLWGSQDEWITVKVDKAQIQPVAPPSTGHHNSESKGQTTPARGLRGSAVSRRHSLTRVPNSREVPKESDAPDSGRYLGAFNPNQSATAQVFRTASRLASFAGPDVTLHGPRLRQRLKPIQFKQFASVYGLSRSPWFQWRQFLLTRKHTRKVRLKRLSHMQLSSDSTGNHLDLIRSQDRLSMLDMDDWDLDLDLLDEATTENMLRR